ncbi:MAG: hypothetical protein JXJ22_01825 [Bacteroidales bacterium]|nr:hypothetical protein [Bacteroidales bacterium]
MNRLTLIIFIFFSISGFQNLLAQGDLDDLLNQEVEVINPVYKPVIGIGGGLFSYFGEVKNNTNSFMLGSPGFNVNVSTFIDNKHYFRGNFFLITGTVTGNERSYSDLNRNFNFQSSIYAFGINLNYDFDHFYKKDRTLHPFISIGVETMTFNSKIDSLDGAGNKYYYWSDGTIRDLVESPSNYESSRFLDRDFNYETNLRDYDWGLGQYPQYSFAIPVEVGLDFWITYRFMVRVATSYHYTFTDLIDHVSSKNTSGIIGNKFNDSFTYTYVSFHLDLFSDSKTLTVERFFAEYDDYDYSIFYDDEDADGIFDGWDDCPGTPYGAEVDTLGCPLDSDLDGVPNYMDDEPGTTYGAFVDDRGVQMSEDDLIALLDQSMAVNRSDVELFIRTPGSYAGGRRQTSAEIPAKFKSVDKDNDNYISFEEMLKAIDNFFDFNSTLSSDDIYDLTDFFFSQ